MTSKITLATFKSFIKKNQDKLLIKVSSNFDGMVDGIVCSNDKSFTNIKKSDFGDARYDLGICGVWLVGSGRDYFSKLELDGLEGIEVSNCCGSFTLATPKTN